MATHTDTAAQYNAALQAHSVAYAQLVSAERAMHAVRDTHGKARESIVTAFYAARAAERTAGDALAALGNVL